MTGRLRRVGVVIYNGVTALDVVGPAEALAATVLPRRSTTGSPEPAYEVFAIGVGSKPCVSESGLAIKPHFRLEEAPHLDTIVIPGGRGLREPRTLKTVAAWLRERAPSTRRIASVCTGAYGLAHSGLLDGRTVTTHWRFAEDLQSKFPKLNVDTDAIYIRDGKFYSSAGVTAGIDLTLALIEEDFGPAAALAVARELVVYVRRHGGQTQFSEPLRYQAESPKRYAGLISFISGHLRADLSVPELARKMAISPRQLSRQCQTALGVSPAALVERLRLDEAKERLLSRDDSIESIALSVGFRSADVFRRTFERSQGIAPSAYRARFSEGSRRDGRIRNAVASRASSR